MNDDWLKDSHRSYGPDSIIDLLFRQQGCQPVLTTPMSSSGTSDSESHEQNLNRSKRNVVKKIWPYVVIPYKMSKFSVNAEKQLETALKLIEKSTRHNGKNCITFVKQRDEKIYIKFVAAASCGSYVGYRKKVQAIYLSKLCLCNGIIAHEFLHTIGFNHEHSRPDRDRFIEINITNIRQGRASNFRKQNPKNVNTLGLPYDLDSVMHYRSNAFAIDPKYPTIISKIKAPFMGQRYGMSQLDIKKLQRTMGCQERDLVKLQNGHIVSPNCTFDNGLCGWNHIGFSQHSKADAWAQHSHFTKRPHTGPLYDHTYGTFEGSYLYTKGAIQSNQTAKIQIPLLSKGNYCLRFWYQTHDYISIHATLRVNQINEGSVSSALFSTKGIEKSKWTKMKMSITSTKNTKIQFEGDTGSSPNVYIAIDDVTFSPRSCKK